MARYSDEAFDTELFSKVLYCVSLDFDGAVKKRIISCSDELYSEVVSSECPLYRETPVLLEWFFAEEKFAIRFWSDLEMCVGVYPPADFARRGFSCIRDEWHLFESGKCSEVFF